MRKSWRSGQEGGLSIGQWPIDRLTNGLSTDWEMTMWPTDQWPIDQLSNGPLTDTHWWKDSYIQFIKLYLYGYNNIFMLRNSYKITDKYIKDIQDKVANRYGADSAGLSTQDSTLCPLPSLDPIIQYKLGNLPTMNVVSDASFKHWLQK